MGLIKKMIFDMENYHKIVGVEINISKRRFIIRTEVFKDVSKVPMDISREYRIDESELVKEFQTKAEAKISYSDVGKEVEHEIEKWEKMYEEKADKNRRDIIKENVRGKAVGNCQVELAKKTMDDILNSKKGIVPLAYECLKMLSVFAGSKDK